MILLPLALQSWGNRHLSPRLVIWCWGPTQSLTNKDMHSTNWHISPAPTIALLFFGLILRHCWGWPQTYHVVKKALNSWSSYPYLPSAGIAGMWHYAQLIYEALGIKPRSSRVLGSISWATLVAPNMNFNSYLVRLKLMPSLCSFKSSGSRFSTAQISVGNLFICIEFSIWCLCQVCMIFCSTISLLSFESLFQLGQSFVSLVSSFVKEGWAWKSIIVSYPFSESVEWGTISKPLTVLRTLVTLALLGSMSLWAAGVCLPSWVCQGNFQWRFMLEHWC